LIRGGRQSLRFWACSRDEPLIWPPLGQSFDSLRERLIDRGAEIYQWYEADRHIKKRWSKRLRVLAILLGAIGGAAPAIGNVLLEFSSAVGYLFLAAAAASVALDKFLGLSTGWIRDMQVMTDLNARTAALYFDLVRAAAANLEGQVVDALGRYASGLENLVIGETREWAGDHSANLAVGDVARQETHFTIAADDNLDN
jgi:hypothetical protein